VLQAGEHILRATSIDAEPDKSARNSGPFEWHKSLLLQQIESNNAFPDSAESAAAPRGRRGRRPYQRTGSRSQEGQEPLANSGPFEWHKSLVSRRIESNKSLPDNAQSAAAPRGRRGRRPYQRTGSRSQEGQEPPENSVARVSHDRLVFMRFELQQCSSSSEDVARPRPRQPVLLAAATETGCRAEKVWPIGGPKSLILRDLMGHTSDFAKPERPPMHTNPPNFGVIRIQKGPHRVG
jgi:hypothetical protein